MAVKKAAKSSEVQKKQVGTSPKKVEKETMEEGFISEADHYVFAQGTHFLPYGRPMPQVFT